MTTRPWTLGEVFVVRHAGFPFDWLESLGVSAEVLADAGRSIETWPVAEQAWERERIEVAYEAERLRLRLRLRELARHPKVKEAVFLSSPDMFENVWARYVDSPLPANNSDNRRVERRIYAYLQRLCAKNETTSFFGPVGYGEVEEDGHSITFVPAKVRRRTFLAYWAVEALAGRAATAPEIWRSLPIRRNPLFQVDVAACEARCDSLDRVVPLSADQILILEAVARLSRAEEIAARCGRPLSFVEDVAMSLFRQGVLVRRLWFRSDQADTLGAFRAALEALPPSASRERWLENIARLDALRADFEVSDLERRRILLSRMEALFVELTGIPARRAGGRLYTDRLIINEETSSPFGLHMGKRAAEDLARALSPLLEMCAVHGRRYQEACIEEVRARSNAPGEVSFLKYAIANRDLRVILPTLPELTAAKGRPAHLSTEGWGDAGPERRFALLDVCLVPGIDGSFHPVLARVHHQLLTRGWMFTFWPDTERVDRMAERWLRDAPTPLAELASGRHNKGYYSFPGPHVAHAPAEMLERDHAVLAAADLKVSFGDGGRPRLRAPDGGELLLYLPLADLTLHPPFTALASPPVVKALRRGGNEHTPRLDMGEATYQRESWELSLAGWNTLSGYALFHRMQGEKVRLGLPRFLFARVAHERKPFLVDTDCPFSVELLRSQARSGMVLLEEMLPAPQDLWLRDDSGRYTFELRMQAERSDRR